MARGLTPAQRRKRVARPIADRLTGSQLDTRKERARSGRAKKGETVRSSPKKRNGNGGGTVLTVAEQLRARGGF